MIPKVLKFALLTAIIVISASAVSAEKGRIYGKIYTEQGDVLEGIIRWDKNEVAWDDILDGTKERETYDYNKKSRKYRDRNREVKVLGWTVFNNDWGSSTAQSGIAFGHIKKLTPARHGGVELALKSGKDVEFISGSTDFGEGIRGIIIETKNEGELELEWDDIDYIEFEDGGNVQSDFGNRLYGTLTTDRGAEFTGWICWDVDEALEDDILDGDYRGRGRKIKFSQIDRIERISSNASLVVTKDGKEIRLDNSNDVDSGNRGIIVSDKGLGNVIVQWDEFESLKFTSPPASAYQDYSDFDGGHPMYGTVYDEDGNSYEGYVRWDDDEEYSWELIDGDYRDIEFNIPLEKIKSIEKISRRSSRVITWDGREFRLRDSNDVNDENKGIIIKKSDDQDPEDWTVIEWDDFEKVEFRK